jgi:hypothetical protein
MDRIAVFCSTWKSPAATRGFVIERFRGHVDGNPERTVRVGNEELRSYLETEYGLDPEAVDSIFRKLASSGEAEVWIEAVPAAWC